MGRCDVQQSHHTELYFEEEIKNYKVIIYPGLIKGRGFSLMLIIPCHNLLLFFHRRL